MKDNDCALKGARFSGCKFEARYDLSPVDVSGLARLKSFEGNLDSLRRRTYVHDICIRCGKVVDRAVEKTKA
jgi:hypothetical protein